MKRPTILNIDYTEDAKPIITPELQAKITEMRRVYRNKKRYIAECKANVSAFMHGTIESWPANIQDRLYSELERTGTARGVKYTIKVSYCDHTPEDGFYVHVIATGEATVQ